MLALEIVFLAVLFSVVANIRWRRKWVFIVLAAFVGVVGVVAAFAIYQADQAARRGNRELKASKKLMDSSEIELVDLRLTPDRNLWGWYALHGRVHNRSTQYGLRQILLKITMRDKLPSGDSEVIGESDVYASVTVPPGQTRELSGENIEFANLPLPRGHFEWSYVIKELEGE